MCSNTLFKVLKEWSDYPSSLEVPNSAYPSDRRVDWEERPQDARIAPRVTHQWPLLEYLEVSCP